MFECYRLSVCVCVRVHMYVCVYVLKCLQLRTVLYGGPTVLFISTVLYCTLRWSSRPGHQLCAVLYSTVVQQSCPPALCCTVQWSSSPVHQLCAVLYSGPAVLSTSSVLYCGPVHQLCGVIGAIVITSLLVH